MNSNPNDLFAEHQRTCAAKPKRKPIERFGCFGEEGVFFSFESLSVAQHWSSRCGSGTVIRLTETEPLERRIAELEAKLARWESARRVHVGRAELGYCTNKYAPEAFVYAGPADVPEYVTLCVAPEDE